MSIIRQSVLFTTALYYSSAKGGAENPKNRVGNYLTYNLYYETIEISDLYGCIILHDSS